MIEVKCEVLCPKCYYINCGYCSFYCQNVHYDEFPELFEKCYGFSDECEDCEIFPVIKDCELCFDKENCELYKKIINRK